MASSTNWQDEKKTEALDWEQSSKLYGREKQEKALKAAYSRRRKRTKPEFVLLTGFSGSGKTVLARSIQTRVEDDWGFFLSGKFDRNQVPLCAFISAVEDFVRQVPLRGEFVAETIRNSVQEAIGPEICVLLEVIPRLEDLLASSKNGIEQDDSSLSEADDADFKMRINENRSRFIPVFCRFIQTICFTERPVCLLLDDVQWADHASLEVIKKLLDPASDNIEGLVLMGTCRGNEVGLGDELAVLLRKLEDGGCTITDIQVGNLDVTDLSLMISDALDLSVKVAGNLAEIVHSQTGGNPFYAKAFVRSLSEEGVLFKDVSGNWVWDDAKLMLQVSEMETEENQDSILQLVTRKLLQLPAVVVDTLKVLSCFGSKFSELILVGTSSIVSSQIYSTLEIAADHGFIHYDFDNGTGHFAHDKFREAAYSLIPESERAIFHLQLGRNLRKQLSAVQVTSNIVAVVNQIKRGLSHVDDPDEKDDFARLFLRAGRQVSKSAAFVTGLEYVKLGIGMLGNRHWRDQYELSLDLFSTCAELSYCVGNLEKVDEMAAEVVANVRCTQDMIRVKMTHIVSLSSRTLVNEGIEMSRDVLKKLGEPYPRKCGKFRVLIEYCKVKYALHDKTEEDILGLPRLEDTRVIATMQVIYAMFPMLAVTNASQTPVLVFRLVLLTLKHGLSSMAAMAFSVYASSLVQLGEYNEAQRWAQLANIILQRYKSRQLQARVKFSLWGTIQVVKEPIRTTLRPILESHRMAMKTGDIEMACAACGFHSIFLIYLGDPLSEIRKCLVHYKDICSSYGQLKAVRLMETVLQFCHNLQGFSKDPLLLIGDYFDEETAQAEILSQNLNNVKNFILNFKFMLAAFLNENAYADGLYRSKGFSVGFIFPLISLYQTFFRGVVSAALARESSGRTRRKHVREARRSIEKLKGLLIHCPDNVMNKIYLIEAELEFCNGRYSTALLHYRKSIGYAEKADFISEQALACEKAGTMLQHARRRPEATDYLGQARSLYELWGAQVKVDQIDQYLKNGA